MFTGRKINDKLRNNQLHKKPKSFESAGFINDALHVHRLGSDELKKIFAMML